MNDTPPLGVRKMHHQNIDSVVLWHEPFITRAFIAHGPQDGRTVAPHSHRTSIKITVLQGWLDHIILKPVELFGDVVTEHTYRSTFLGGSGLSAPIGSRRVYSTSDTLWPGQSAMLAFDQVHTVDWSDNAIWVVEEGPLMTDETLVWMREQDEFTTEGMYEPMSELETKTRRDSVWRLWKTL